MSISRITVEEIQRKLLSGDKLRFLDVREPDEYALARIENSQLIPLGELTTRTHEVEIDDDELLVVYCHHGIRSLTGVALLQQAGITNAASLSGGIDAWSIKVDPSVPRY